MRIERIGAATLNDVIHADALACMATLESGSVAMICTDPPYGIAYHSNHYVGENPHAPVANDWNFQIGFFLAEAARVLRPGGALYLFTRWDVFPLWAREVPPTLSLKNAIIWAKDNWSSGDLTGNFGFQYEIMMFITKGRHTIRGKRWPNLWSVPRVTGSRLRAPTEKPVALFERAIRASSDDGDLVIDPFCGSGTCAEAAILTGRKYLCCDIDERMVAVARRRVELPALPSEVTKRVMPLCPVFGAAPPDPALWGVHPEDIAVWRDLFIEAPVADDPQLARQADMWPDPAP